MIKKAPAKMVAKSEKGESAKKEMQDYKKIMAKGKKK